MGRIFFTLTSLFFTVTVYAGTINWIKHTRFFSYTPSGFHFENGRSAVLSQESIEHDLRLLRRYSDGLILYATDENSKTIVEIAHKLKFKAVILGVWGITDKQELNHAIALARRSPALIRAVAIGNEGLFFKRYGAKELHEAYVSARQLLPNTALTTTEPFASYLGHPALLGCRDQDFLLPTIHPVFESWFTPKATTQSVTFVKNVVKHLYQLCHKDVLVKETGVPSGPETLGYSEQHQLMFWKALLERTKAISDVSVSLFEAFDAPWKVAEMKYQSGKYDERERYWGWFNQFRKPKAVAGLLKTIN